ncbi:MAG: prepilin-type N-terminal cleavage/methylation domain-containing protein [Kiritimatiellae bacterium]|nr:prepilin-type N-terminal cleavage/methylation domain-containing protein [Verrucomicrobiota bacterium]MCG2659812.1 prepilin-type N-terminal cleavage/methylation domain-containing protein [Kiritimatiellia bacterium]
MIRSRHALTLIELLVAMSIAVLLAAVVFAIYAGVLRTLDSQSRWRAHAYPAAAALDALTLDLASAVIPWGTTNSPFVLTPSLDGADGIKLHFFTATPMSAAPRNAAQVYPALRGTTDPPAQCGASLSRVARDLSRFELDVRAYAIREMDYTLSASNAAGTSGLIRTWAAFRIDEADGADDSAGIASNKDIWGSVRAIRLEVFDGTRWTNTWGGGTNASLPQAARVMLVVGDDSVSRRTAEVLIPAGHRIAAPKSRK